MSDSTDYNTECPICLDEMPVPYKLDCGHSLHYLCVKEAYEKHNRSCPLCRHPISSAVYDEAVLTKDVELDDYKWFYSGKSDGWWGYAEEHQEELEKAYQEYLTNASENFHQMTILGKVYIIDFSRMTQRLKGTSMVRKIKRDADREEDFIKGISGMRFQDS